jgi:hypothetical protein
MKLANRLVYKPAIEHTGIVELCKPLDNALMCNQHEGQLPSCHNHKRYARIESDIRHVLNRQIQPGPP